MRLYAPEDGGTKYQVMFRASAGDGEPWKRVLRRANSEDEARKIFAQAEAALDTEKDTPAGADVRVSRTVEMLGKEYLEDSIERGKQTRTMEQRESRLNAHILPTIGGVPVAKWRVEHSRPVLEKGAKAIFSQRGREDLRKLAWLLGWLDRSIDPLDGLEIGKGPRPARSDGAVRRPAPPSRDATGERDGRCRRYALRPGRHRPATHPSPLFGAKIRVADFGGLRLGEQNALRVIDVFFEHGYVHVNGARITPRGSAGFRGPVKNHTLHRSRCPSHSCTTNYYPASRSCSA